MSMVYAAPFPYTGGTPWVPQTWPQQPQPYVIKTSDPYAIKTSDPDVERLREENKELREIVKALTETLKEMVCNNE